MHPIHFDVVKAFKDGQQRKYDEQAFYGPVNLLLAWYFSLERGFVVAPRSVPIGCYDEKFESTIEFEVQREGKPVLVVLVKPALSLNTVTSRIDADAQLRIRFSDRHTECPLEVLHGLVFFGCNFAFYRIECKTHRWNPPVPTRNPYHVAEEPALERYSHDVTAEASAENLVDCFDGILRACRALDQQM